MAYYQIALSKVVIRNDVTMLGIHQNNFLILVYESDFNSIYTYIKLWSKNEVGLNFPLSVLRARIGSSPLIYFSDFLVNKTNSAQ